MHPINSFAPICSPSAAILILGSIPSKASLSADQYYAHPRNAFWPVMSRIVHFDTNLPYDARVNALKTANIAVWDVLQQCIRPGSLDSAIQSGSRIANDFVTFFKHHPHIRLIAFNGVEAETSFKKHVLVNLKRINVSFVRLPSSSPAHTMSFEKKLLAWRSLLTI